MAISLEELAAIALEGSVGPVTLAVGAGALAVALAAGSARPIRRIAATSGVVAERAGQRNLAGWLGNARRGWIGLVDEARAEYEASRSRQGHAAATTVLVANADGVVVEGGSGVVTSVPAVQAAGEPHETGRVRDQRGRFVRRATNGAHPE